MSLSCAEKQDNCAASGRPGSPWSLTLRLTLFNACAAFSILCLVAALLYAALAYQLDTQNRLYLHEKIGNIAASLRSGDAAGLSGEFSSRAGGGYLRHYARLLDRSGRVIMATPGMAGSLPAQAFPRPDHAGPAADRTLRASDGKLLGSSLVWLGPGGTGGQGILQVALEPTGVDQLLLSYRNTIYACLVCGGALCLLTSLLVSRREVGPLRDLADQLQGITLANLQDRIVGSHWPPELNLLADALNLMLERLEDSFSRLHASAANFTHKMRTPLTILRGEAELALSRDSSVEELREVLVSSLEEHNRLSRLTDNVRFLNFADTGALAPARREFDAIEEIEKVIDFYAPVAEEKGVTISCCGSARLYADPSLFRKAVAALISNALTYNCTDGRVALELRQGEGPSCVLTVSDSGCGIAADEMPKIFDRFYRIYATRYSDPHGTGLGLSIVKMIMDLHNGSIGIESRHGAGTAVTLTFPAPAG